MRQEEGAPAGKLKAPTLHNRSNLHRTTSARSAHRYLPYLYLMLGLSALAGLIVLGGYIADHAPALLTIIVCLVAMPVIIAVLLMDVTR